jgi:hypothetical protein
MDLSSDTRLERPGARSIRESSQIKVGGKILHRNLVYHVVHSGAASVTVSGLIPQAKQICCDPSVAWVLVLYMLVETRNCLGLRRLAQASFSQE